MPKKAAKQTYAASGVDRDGHSDITLGLRTSLTRNDPRVLNKIGAFASLFEASFPGISDPVLVLKAEEPGSKQLLAKQTGKIENIGYDMINHLINDIIVMGGRPLAVLDVIVVGKLIKEDINTIISAINQACVNHGCSLVGGEISEQPGVLGDGVFVLSSTVVGVVSKKKIINGGRIKKGDKVIALTSNGLHTNGYSLVRKLIADKPEIKQAKVGKMSFLDAVLLPHTAYYPYLKDILDSPKVKGLAHITGDGILGNLERILPEGLSAQVDLDTIEILPVFKTIHSVGSVPEEDILNNLNLGVGMCMVVAPKEEAAMIKYLETQGIHSYHIGEIITDTDNTVKFSGKLNWK